MVKEVNWQISTYLADVRSGDISENQDVQRRFCSDNAFINGIAVTILTGDYLPPIILGEIPIGGGLVQQYIVDAMQRTSALMLIRYGNYRITRSVEGGVIEYQTKRRDDNGAILKDDEGNILWDKMSFDIRGKKFDQFPKELQDRFDKYQLHIVIHQGCDMKMISKLVRRYNNHRAMNASQKAFTCIENFARKARMISESGFFKNSMKYSTRENQNGKYENVVCKAVAAIFHLDKWNASPAKLNAYLNDNATDKEFEIVGQYADELEELCGENYQDIFLLKNVHIWFAVYHKFKQYGKPIAEFKSFLDAFRNNLKFTEIDGANFDTLCKSRSTTQKSVVVAKYNYLCKIMESYFVIESDDDSVLIKESKETTFDFVKRVVSDDLVEEDINFYEGMFDDLTIEVDNNSPLLDVENHKSMIALVAYSVENDMDLDKWFVDYFGRNSSYISNQTENYKYMKDDLEKYLRENAA